MKYLSLLLFLAVAFFSCEKEPDAFIPSKETSEVIYEKVVMGDDAGFQNALAYLRENIDPKTGQPTVTAEDLLLRVDLSILAKKLFNLAENQPANISFADHLTNRIIYPKPNSRDKVGGPCYEEYKQATTTSSIEFAICLGSAEGWEGFSTCTARTALALANAEVDYNQCLRANYPNADKP